MRSVKYLLISLSLLFIATHATAKSLPAAKVAVFDIQQALMQSKRVQNELKQAEQKFAGEQNRVRQLAEEVRKLQERLQRDESIMSLEQKRQANKQLEEKAQEYQFLGSRLQKQLRDIEQEVINRNRPKLEDAVNAVIKEKQIDLLIDRQAAQFAKPEFDITQAVIDKMNR